MKAAKGRGVGFIIGIISLVTFFPAIFSEPGLVCAADAWLKEFDAVCSQTDDAMDLTKDQLKQLVDRCDRLKPIIQKQDQIQMKVYLKRLDNCRNFYKFMLESKERSAPQP